jgi:hypothetical protein
MGWMPPSTRRFWQQTGEPSGKDDEFYHQAKKELQEALDRENQPRRE